MSTNSQKTSPSGTTTRMVHRIKKLATLAGLVNIPARYAYPYSKNHLGVNMKLLHLTKIATLASLLALSNISCAADPVKPSTTVSPTTYPSTTEPTTAEPGAAQPNIQGGTAAATTGGSRTFEPAAAFKTSRDGSFIPINKFGKEFVPCSTNGKGNCEINNKPVLINKLETTVITEIVHTGSPTCLLYCVQRPSGRPQVCYFDPSVPECAALNK